MQDEQKNRRGEAFSFNPNRNKKYHLKNASPLLPNNRPHGTKPGSLSSIVQNYESVTTRKINKIRRIPGQKLWQRNFYEHIIRDENNLKRIREYIINNPLKWELDNENPNKL